MEAKRQVSGLLSGATGFGAVAAVDVVSGGIAGGEGFHEFLFDEIDGDLLVLFWVWRVGVGGAGVELSEGVGDVGDVSTGGGGLDGVIFDGGHGGSPYYGPAGVMRCRPGKIERNGCRMDLGAGKRMSGGGL